MLLKAKIPGTKIENAQGPPCTFSLSSIVSLSSSGWIDVGPINRGHRETTKQSFGKNKLKNYFTKTKVTKSQYQSVVSISQLKPSLILHLIPIKRLV